MEARPILTSEHSAEGNVSNTENEDDAVTSTKVVSLDVASHIEEKVKPETTEIWRYLVKEEVAKELDQPLSEIELLVRKVITEFGIISMTALSSIPEHVFLRQGIPAAFCHLLRQGVPVNKNATEIEVFLWSHGFNHGLNSEEIRLLIECVVEKHWFETWNDLRVLPPSTWSRLDIKDGSLLRKLQVMLDEFEAAEARMKITATTVRQLIAQIGERLGKDRGIADAIAERITREYGVESAEDMLKLPEAQFMTLPMPMKLLIEIAKLRPEGLDLSTEGSARKQVALTLSTEDSPHDTGSRDSQLRNWTYAEPDSSTFLMRVGRKYDHTAEEVRTVIDVLVHQHWLKTLSKLRELSDRDWEELFLSRKFVNEIKEALVDPAVLGMTAVWQDPPPPDLFPYSLESAVKELYEEMSPEDRPILLRSFMRLLEILIVLPSDASKRSIRKANPNYAARAAKYNSVPIFFLSIGYVDFSSHFLMPTLYRTKIQDAHSQLATYACRLSDFPTVQRGARTPQGPPIRSLLPSSQSLWDFTGEFFKSPEPLVTLLGRNRA